MWVPWWLCPLDVVNLPGASGKVILGIPEGTCRYRYPLNKALGGHLKREFPSLPLNREQKQNSSLLESCHHEGFCPFKSFTSRLLQQNSSDSGWAAAPADEMLMQIRTRSSHGL